ncbi:unnamed protein product [Brugia timori]|uniref:Uncharacterized protein n=1 Tax=Brugia timori TaxID=42155 RepID=A0A0R3QSP9_9BILA|nr:unnamed protein product [Brugia timori]
MRNETTIRNISRACVIVIVLKTFMCFGCWQASMNDCLDNPFR